MQIFAGTSGFSYAAWCGRFYPEALPGAQMLRFYADRLPTVEINNSFYRLPNRETVAGWRDQVPDSFCFAVKAPRRITHQKKIADVAADVAQLFGVIDVLDSKLGPVLFQLPPFLKKDSALLEAFLASLPPERRVAMEFRHPSWFADDVYGLLSQHNVALVGGDLEDTDKSPPLVATADFGYLRLRRLDYDPAGIAEWAARIQAQSWQRVHAYLKHEVLGPLFAEQLLATMNGLPMADLSDIRAAMAAPAKPSKRAPASEKKPAPKSSPPKSSKSSPPKSNKSSPPKNSKSNAPKNSKSNAPKNSKSNAPKSTKPPSRSQKT